MAILFTPAEAAAFTKQLRDGGANAALIQTHTEQLAAQEALLKVITDAIKDASLTPEATVEVIADALTETPAVPGTVTPAFPS